MTTTETNKAEQLNEIGKSAYASIFEMVAAADCDYDQLETLRDARDSFEANEDTEPTWELDEPADAKELKELEKAAGDCESAEDAEERINDDPLSLRVFGERIDGEWQADRFELLLTTGGPAVRIVGELDEHGEATSATLQVQDWFTPWTDYTDADEEVLLSYCRRFCFAS